MSNASDLEATLYTERVLPFSPAEVFSAFEKGELLARWWGPEGFTNTFEQFEFRPGGQWVFVMHGPDGSDYANECVFREIQPDKIVIQHLPLPHFTLTITLTPEGQGAHLAWAQAFESAEVAAQLRQLCGPANEQNLDRLEAVLAATSTGR